MAALKMTRRSRNGAFSRKVHSVPNADYAGRPALCGARPNIGAVGAAGIIGAKGWSSASQDKVTCARCVAALAKARGKAA